MTKSTQPRDRTQRWCLTGLAGSPRELRQTERRLTRALGHEPSLYEVVEDLMVRQRIAAPFTAPPEQRRDDSST